jgi:hypothetical protein
LQKIPALILAGFGIFHILGEFYFIPGQSRGTALGPDGNPNVLLTNFSG